MAKVKELKGKSKPAADPLAVVKGAGISKRSNIPDAKAKKVTKAVVNGKEKRKPKVVEPSSDEDDDSEDSDSSNQSDSDASDSDASDSEQVTKAAPKANGKAKAATKAPDSDKDEDSADSSDSDKAKLPMVPRQLLSLPTPLTRPTTRTAMRSLMIRSRLRLPRP